MKASTGMPGISSSSPSCFEHAVVEPDVGAVVALAERLVLEGVGGDRGDVARELGRGAPVEGGEVQRRLLAHLHLVDMDRVDAAADDQAASFGTMYMTGSAARITPSSVSAALP